MGAIFIEGGGTGTQRALEVTSGLLLGVALIDLLLCTWKLCVPAARGGHSAIDQCASRQAGIGPPRFTPQTIPQRVT